MFDWIVLQSGLGSSVLKQYYDYDFNYITTLLTPSFNDFNYDYDYDYIVQYLQIPVTIMMARLILCDIVF